MNTVLQGQNVALVDRRLISVLGAYSIIAKGSGDLACEIAEAASDGHLAEQELQKLRVTAVHLRTRLNELEAVLG